MNTSTAGLDVATEVWKNLAYEKEKEKMKILAKIWDKITAPFIGIAVALEESRNVNEDGSWDRYWERQARKRQRKENRKNR